MDKWDIVLWSLGGYIVVMTLVRLMGQRFGVKRDERQRKLNLIQREKNKAAAVEAARIEAERRTEEVKAKLEAELEARKKKAETGRGVPTRLRALKEARDREEAAKKKAEEEAQQADAAAQAAASAQAAAALEAQAGSQESGPPTEQPPAGQPPTGPAPTT